MVARRGTSNTNDRGNNRQRKQRREAMVQNWRANEDLLVVDDGTNPPYSRAIAPRESFLDVVPLNEIEHAVRHAACRCWRCGKLLTADTVTIDRWPVPGIDGGKYTATNTRPACDKCNPTTGATIRKGDSHQLQILVLELES